MDLGFTEEQETLRDSARALVASETSATLAREPAAPPVDAVWTRMVELGWPAVTIGTEHGGAGMGPVELAILLEEVGRGVVPGPLLATAGLYVPALRAAPAGPARDERLSAVASGRTGTLALTEEAGSWSWDELATTAVPRGDGYEITGRKQAVVEGTHADELIVVARAPDGPGLFAVARDAVDAVAMNAVDPSLRLATIVLDRVPVERDQVFAVSHDAKVALGSALDEALVAVSSLSVGVCGGILERTIEYAKTRKQFGHAIGAFQAVKHKLTDMYVAVERARSLAYFGALTVAENDPRRPTAAAMAKAAAGDCQRIAVQDGLQLHGGIGYTWEFDLQLYLKRATALEALLGSSRFHRRRIAEQLGLKTGA